ncbi:MAG TPA: hypothetical protein VJW73_00765 [Gemmatimonadaceae bacterium]|nr:hypothetical protein [Gemmatimonadaceae bacterium]
MNIVHLHLLLNHFPVIGAIISALLLAVALLRRSSELAKISLAFLALIGAMSVVVFLTGDPAQDALEKLPGFSERLADRHEDAALVATVVTGVIGALALGAMIVYRQRAVPRWLTMLVLVCAVGASAMMGYTAYLGGQIRHTELRPSSSLGDGGSPALGAEHDEH